MLVTVVVCGTVMVMVLVFGFSSSDLLKLIGT